MTREDTKLTFPVAMPGPAAAKWRGQAVHMLLPDHRLGDRGTVELEVRHGQGATYRYNVPVPNVVVTTAAAESSGSQSQWKSEPRSGEPLHAEVLRGPGRAEVEDGAELSTAQHEKENQQREAAT